MSDLLDMVNLDEMPSGPPSIPANDYPLQVVDVEVRDTQEGGGKYLSYRAVVQDGPFAGRSVFGLWMLKNAAGKQDSTWRTKADFKRLGIELGTVSISDLIEALRGIQGVAKVSEQPKRDRDGSVPDENDKENRIRQWIRRL